MLYQDWDLELTGESTRITPMHPADDEAYGRLLLGDTLYETFIRETNGKSCAWLDRILDHKTDETHAIRLIHDERFIGWITFFENNDGEPELGMSLIEECRNKGYGPEAAMLFVNYLHHAYGLRQVSVRIEDKNLQSQVAFSKLGAKFDKKLPDKCFKTSENPAEIDSDSIPMVYCFHIPLPVKAIRPSAKAAINEAQKQKAQEAYEQNRKRLTQKWLLDELETIRKAIQTMDHPTTEAIEEYLVKRQNELKRT